MIFSGTEVFLLFCTSFFYSKYFFYYFQLVKFYNFFMESKIHKMSPFLKIPIKFKLCSSIFTKALPLILFSTKFFSYYFIFIFNKNFLTSSIVHTLIWFVEISSKNESNWSLKSSSDKESMLSECNLVKNELLDYIIFLLL